MHPAECANVKRSSVLFHRHSIKSPPPDERTLPNGNRASMRDQPPSTSSLRSRGTAARTRAMRRLARAASRLRHALARRRELEWSRASPVLAAPVRGLQRVADAQARSLRGWCPTRRAQFPATADDHERSLGTGFRPGLRRAQRRGFSIHFGFSFHFQGPRERSTGRSRSGTLRRCRRDQRVARLRRLLRGDRRSSQPRRGWAGRARRAPAQVARPRLARRATRTEVGRARARAEARGARERRRRTGSVGGLGRRCPRARDPAAGAVRRLGARVRGCDLR